MQTLPVKADVSELLYIDYVEERHFPLEGLILLLQIPS